MPTCYLLSYWKVGAARALRSHARLVADALRDEVSGNCERVVRQNTKNARARNGVGVGRSRGC